MQPALAPHPSMQQSSSAQVSRDPSFVIMIAALGPCHLSMYTWETLILVRDDFLCMRKCLHVSCLPYRVLSVAGANSVP